MILAIRCLSVARNGGGVTGADGEGGCWHQWVEGQQRGGGGGGVNSGGVFNL